MAGQPVSRRTITTTKSRQLINEDVFIEEAPVVEETLEVIEPPVVEEIPEVIEDVVVEQPKKKKKRGKSKKVKEDFRGIDEGMTLLNEDK